LKLISKRNVLNKIPDFANCYVVKIKILFFIYQKIERIYKAMEIRGEIKCVKVIDYNDLIYQKAILTLFICNFNFVECISIEM
jgi:hypothetical protein